MAQKNAKPFASISQLIISRKYAVSANQIAYLANQGHNHANFSAQLWQARQEINRPVSRAGKVRALQESAALFSFLQTNGITSMQQLYEKIADMNSRYYSLRGEIVTAERRIAALNEKAEMWAQYRKYCPIRKQLDRVNPDKQQLFRERHSRELILYDAADRFLKGLKDNGEELKPKEWKSEITSLTAEKERKYAEMRVMREEIKAAEQLKKTAERLAQEGDTKTHEPER